MSDRDEIAVSARITGRVQGVGYRAWCARAAMAYGLRGWVRNCADGSVEALFAGPRGNVEAMLQACRQGPPHGHVSDLSMTDMPLPPGLTEFVIRHQ
ncbi:MAG: acylphosphatase [Pseudomonadota bacterium]